MAAANPAEEMQGVKPKSYIDQAGHHIEKLLLTARKKKEERRRATKMLERDEDASKEPTRTTTVEGPTSALISDSSNLHDYFSVLENKEVLFRRLGMHTDKMRRSLRSRHVGAFGGQASPIAAADAADENKRRIAKQLVQY